MLLDTEGLSKAGITAGINIPWHTSWIAWLAQSATIRYLESSLFAGPSSRSPAAMSDDGHK
jgi:hypothetical protein